jgi:hypothetical protein
MLGELRQADPARLLAAAIAVRARNIAGVGAPFIVLALANGQVSLTLAIQAFIESMDFDRLGSFLVELKNHLSPRQAWVQAS